MCTSLASELHLRLFRLHKAAPVVQFALLFWSLDQGQEAMQLTREIVSALPPDINAVFAAVNAPPAPFVPQQLHPPPATRKLFDEANDWGFHAYDKGAYLEDLSDPVIDVVTEHVPGKQSPISVPMLYRLDGAYSQVGEDETAFSGGRSPRYAASSSGWPRTPVCWPPSAAGPAASGRP